MTTPSSTPPAGDDRNLVAVDETYIAPTFEDRLQQFWQKNRGLILGLCVAIVVVILAKGGWEYLARQKELEIEKAYAAATTPEQLKAFAAAHADHSLAGISHLRTADDAYTAGKSADALASYEKAAAALSGSPLAARAQMGKALAKIQAGKASDGAADLKQLAGDASQFKAVRAEAAYHLASLAADAGDGAEVQKFSDQLMQIDPSSPWTQRGLMLRASMPGTKAAATEQKKSSDSSSLQIKLPGK